MHRFVIPLFAFLLFWLSGCSPLLQRPPAPAEPVQLQKEALKHVVRGAWQESLRDPRRAVYEYNLALLHDSTSVEIRRALAENYLRLGEYESFIKHTRFVLHREPLNHQLRSRLAIVYHHLGDLPATIGQIEFLLNAMTEEERNDPDYGEEELLSLLLELYAVKADGDAFLEVFHRFLARGYLPEVEILTVYHRLVEERESVDRELAFLRRLGGEQPAAFHLQLLQTDLLLRAERLPAAAKLLLRACAANQDRVEAWYSLAYFQRNSLDDDSAAYLTLVEGLERFPLQPELMLELATLEEARDSLAAAEELLLELRELTDELTADFYLSEFYQRHAGYRAKALAHFRYLLIDMELEDATLMNNYAYLLVDDSTAVSETELDEALHYSRLSLEIEPENPSFLDTIGWIHYRRGEPEKALAYLQQALRLSPEQLEILDHIVIVLEELDPEEAEIMRRRAAAYRRQLENNERE